MAAREQPLMVDILILCPPGWKHPSDLIPELNKFLLRIQVGFTLEATSSEDVRLQLIYPSRSEKRLVIRLLKRAGYTLELNESDTTDL